jgi:hypothetical protein
MAYYIRFRGLGDVPILPNSAAQGFAFESRYAAPLITIPRTEDNAALMFIRYGKICSHQPYNSCKCA